MKYILYKTNNSKYRCQYILKIDRQFGFVNNRLIALAAGALTVLVNYTFNSSFKTLSTTGRIGRR